MAERPRLLDQVRQEVRTRRYSLRTKRAHVLWVKRFVRFHVVRHPRELGAPEIREFLGRLAVSEQVSASTQDQARSALLFLYREVPRMSVTALEGIRVVTLAPNLIPGFETQLEEVRRY